MEVKSAAVQCHIEAQCRRKARCPGAFDAAGPDHGWHSGSASSREHISNAGTVVSSLDGADNASMAPGFRAVAEWNEFRALDLAGVRAAPARLVAGDLRNF
ncbi:hypothetical protein [Oleomonas cavernae]|uniref:hypothetical protein n=1 Tax=Oleomonas cavernae TaxID=2320859 RepID=UPI0011C40533|nr:hypothetical protein [Oleomonas cavernae]